MKLFHPKVLPSILRLLGVNLSRMLRRPLFWLASAGVGIVKFVCVFGNSEVYRDVLIKRTWNSDLFYLSVMYSWGRSILPYIGLCLAALPVVLLYIQDDKSNRMCLVLPKSGVGGYALAQAFSVLLGSFLCMMCGIFLFYLAGHFGVGLPLAGETARRSLGYDRCLYGHLLYAECMDGLKAAFLALLSALVAYLVRNAQFVTILPMIFNFFFTYDWDGFLFTVGLPLVFSPKRIYDYWWTIYESELRSLGLAVFHVCLTALGTAAVLWLLLRSRKGR